MKHFRPYRPDEVVRPGDVCMMASDEQSNAAFSTCIVRRVITSQALPHVVQVARPHASYSDFWNVSVTLEDISIPLEGFRERFLVAVTGASDTIDNRKS